MCVHDKNHVLPPAGVLVRVCKWGRCWLPLFWFLREDVLTLASSLLLPQLWSWGTASWWMTATGPLSWVEHGEIGLCPPPLDQREAAIVGKCLCSADLTLPSDAVVHGLAWRP